MDVIITDINNIPPNTPDSQIFIVQKRGKELLAIASETIIGEFNSIPNEYFILPFKDLVNYMNASRLTYEIIAPGVKL